MILVPENITSICTGVQTRTETGVWRIRCPNSPLGKLVPCLSWAGEHTGMGCRALGCESQVIPLQCWGSGLPEAHCHARMWLSARAVCGWEKAGRTGTFLLSAPDRFWPTAPRFVGTQGGPCLFLPAQLTSPNMEKEVDLWPGDAQDKGAIRPAGLQGKQREDQEWEIKGTESPPGSGSNQNENCSVMFDILYFFLPPPQHIQYCLRSLPDLLGLWWTSFQKDWPSLITASHMTFISDKQLWLK